MAPSAADATGASRHRFVLWARGCWCLVEMFTPEAKVFGNVWFYDIKNDLWCEMPKLKVPRHGLAAGRIDDHVYAFGGAKVGGRGTSDVNERLFVKDLLPASRG